MPKANLWIFNYCILERKADNEPAISLPVYFKFVKKWKYVLRKKTQNKQKDQKIKKRNECFWRRKSNPGPLTYRMNALSIAKPANFEYNSGTIIKLIILKSFAHKNSASRHCLKPVERYLWRIERYIRGKQTWFWQLKLYSFRRLWRAYDRQVSRKTVAKSLAESLTIQQQ